MALIGGKKEEKTQPTPDVFSGELFQGGLVEDTSEAFLNRVKDFNTTLGNEMKLQIDDIKKRREEAENGLRELLYREKEARRLGYNLKVLYFFLKGRINNEKENVLRLRALETYIMKQAQSAAQGEQREGGK